MLHSNSKLLNNTNKINYFNENCLAGQIRSKSVFNGRTHMLKLKLLLTFFFYELNQWRISRPILCISIS